MMIGIKYMTNSIFLNVIQYTRILSINIVGIMFNNKIKIYSC